MKVSADRTGVVKSYSDAKGYGFIAPDDKSADVFVAITAIEAAGLKTLKPGQRIVFATETSPKGTQASNVRLAK